ncbi:RidA family protein [Basilea psittacipulmonis]|uniref:Aminoacrylate peracid reductase n=1 Tax=Basilea psittacipulmonis DSM 24701 TaxID=1072685 RepID=A0A077DBC8_9BURK|nr:RidA family protein [Basilea psittacipulmonis]AIL32160.1 aminoacrylate peracid reductase [Basilea psittacipulmonis DSM 24701]
MKEIKRVNVEARYSDMAVYNGVAYLAGQVPNDLDKDMYGQTQEVLEMVDQLLAIAGSDKDRILMAQLFIADINDISEMNRAWDEWVSKTNAPPRATVEAKLANPKYKVEIVVTAALK